MTSYTTIKKKQEEDSARALDDIHLVFDQNVNVKSIDGKTPDNGDYTLEGDGSSSITISDISKGYNSEINIRVEGSQDKKPKVKSWYWTLKGETVGQVHAEQASSGKRLESVALKAKKSEKTKPKLRKR